MIQIIKDDPWLAPYEGEVSNRIKRYQSLKARIEKDFGSLYDFADGHHYFGIQYDEKMKGWHYREWAPEAQALSFVGDFNNWDNQAHLLKRIGYGVWEVFIPETSGFGIGSNYKLWLKGKDGKEALKIPAYAEYIVQDPSTNEFCPQVISTDFKWTDQKFSNEIKTPIIYECHIGMAQEKEGVGTYLEFIKNNLPRIKKTGYNCIQIMGIHEHPYYGSFGYHVSNFFASSSRFGTPVELKKLIDTAHNMGISVIMDVVHSHSVKNIVEGLNNFDGSGHHYFHEGERGNHPYWDSKCFDYGKTEVQRFLLSNIRYWLEEFHFDGFRFDGVTSMLYHHHGHITFDHYDKYFKDGIEHDAEVYLMLANDLIHEIKPNTLSIAEDMSGMPGLCRSIADGGYGFDYRLAMGLPDYWIKILKHLEDENWNVHEIYKTLTDRRWAEKNISYAESHDQALVGDKTLAFWLMDKEMYTSMSKKTPSLIVDRGMALHKIIRFISMVLGGDAYMTFIGNEFGHPEWMDFPREGNDWSYKYARRQWSLVDNTELKYEYLNNFEQDMLAVQTEYDFLSEPKVEELNIDQDNHTIVIKRGELIFVFNLSPHHSVANYKFYVPNAGEYSLVFNSDEIQYGGFSRLDSKTKYNTISKNGEAYLSIYNVNRAVQVFKINN